jgi:hypothetical protein
MRKLVFGLVVLLAGCAELESVDKMLQGVTTATLPGVTLPSAQTPAGRPGKIVVGRGRDVPKNFKFNFTLAQEDNYSDLMRISGDFSYVHVCQPLQIFYTLYGERGNTIKMAANFTRINVEYYTKKPEDGRVDKIIGLSITSNSVKDVKSAKITEIQCVRSCIWIGGKRSCA